MGAFVAGAAEAFFALEAAKADRAANDTGYRREKARANAAINTAMEVGAFESGKQRLLTSQLVAKQRQAYAASGVDPTKGTAAAVQSDTTALGGLDAQALAIRAAREAWGYRTDKEQMEEEYQNRRRAIDNKELGGLLGGMTKVVSGTRGGRGE